MGLIWHTPPDFAISLAGGSGLGGHIGQVARCWQDVCEGSRPKQPEEQGVVKKHQLDMVRNRFESEALDFDAIYRQDRGIFHTWFNRTFRKPVFERYEITFQTVGDPRGKTILDIGCGSGIYGVNFALKGARCVLGIDFSSQMIKLARRRASEYGVEHICQFEQADFLTIDLQDSFDFSIAMGVFDYLPDPVTFLQRMKAVTSGQSIISLPGHSLIRESLRKLRYRLLSKGGVFFYSRGDIENIVRQAGVFDYQLRPVTTGTGVILIANS
jgi:ubiquinone/menaquinone biosynthesis C-methylase UbiE